MIFLIWVILIGFWTLSVMDVWIDYCDYKLDLAGATIITALVTGMFLMPTALLTLATWA